PLQSRFRNRWQCSRVFRADLFASFLSVQQPGDTMRLLKVTILLACALALCPALQSCTREQAGSGSVGSSTGRTTGRKKIVFVFKIGGIGYSEACKAGAEQANQDPSIGADVEYQASTEGTAGKQADIINQAVVGHADAIVVSPVDAGAVVPALDNAAAQGVKVFTWDADAPDSKRLFYVAAADDVAIGRDVGEALSKSIGGKGTVLIFSGQRTAENLNKHVQGIVEDLKSHPGITISQPYIYNDDQDKKATDMAVEALQANPDAVGIACSNSVSPPAAGAAIRKAGLVGKVKVWGLGLPSQNKDYLADGSVTGLYLWDPKKLTFYTARLVKDALDGKMPADGEDVPGLGKISVKDGIVTLPLKLQITRQNVSQYSF
ncbi:MAG TPA: autoinducer 2 ABC transporter substrate-binding protein, partial [Chthonomonadales bacterium]|nr:autoinducer 2 ABC transporter substrate-binding protein [Chthonomonadales bacterium]